MISLEQLLRVPYVEPELGFDISPVGGRVAFAWNVDGGWEIYTACLDGQGLPTRLTHGPGGKFSPRWSPDGTRLAYAFDPVGSEDFHIFIQDTKSGEVLDLLPDHGHAIQPSFSWSPDGKEIAFLSDSSGCFCAYIVPSNGGEPRQVFGNGQAAHAVKWSPDGRHLAVTTESTGQEFGTFIVPLSGKGETWQVSDYGKPLNTHGVSWSPDGKKLAFACDANGQYDIAVKELDSPGILWIASGPGERTNPDWSPDGRLLAWEIHKGTTSWLEVWGMEYPRQYQLEHGVNYFPTFTPDGEHLVFAFDNPANPDDLWRVNLEDGKFQRLTDSRPETLSRVSFSMPEEIRYPGLDGVMVPALLFKPPVQGPAPAVVIAHGGPTWHFSQTWYPVMAYMVSRGWVVLAPNFRGSTGYGKEWQLANHMDLGGVDTRDCAAGAMYLVREGLADPKRVGITARSHGGYLTMSCMTQFPELWAAGSAVVPFLDMFLSHEHSRADLQQWNIENMGDPVKHHDLWYERSPYFFLDRLKAPVQLICGGNDPRCPAVDSVRSRDRLVELGKEVDLLLYPDEGHMFLKIENIIEAETRRIEFLAKYLEAE